MTETSPTPGRPGRRRAERHRPGRQGRQGRRSRQGRRGALSLLAGLLLPLFVATVALLAGNVAPTADGPTQGTGAGRAPVDRLLQTCLHAGAPRSGSTLLTVPVPAADAVTGEAGTAVVSPPSRSGSQDVDAARGVRTEVDVAQSDTRNGAPGATTLEATGAAAAGRSTLRVDRGPRGLLAVQQCDEPRTHWWFTGAGAGLDHRSVLLLGNPDPGATVLDVRVLGPDGAVESVGTRGLTLAPGETRAVDLVEIAPQGDELAVEVSTSRGRVVAAVDDSYARSVGVDPGAEWVPSQARVARRLRLGPLAPRTGPQTLVVANPASAREALVEVAVAGSGGTFAPTDLTAVRVPPESVVSVDLPRDVRREAASLLLRSTTPVTASVRTVSGNDHAYAAALEPLDQPALAVLPDGVEALLALTAGERPATVRVRALDAAGDVVRERDLEIGPGATASWALPRRAASVWVDVTAGRVVGAVSLGGDGVSQVPLRSAVFALDRPAVVPAPR